MSALNLLVSVFIPTYPKMYLVRNSIMDEAELFGGEFHGVVASVKPGDARGIESISDAQAINVTFPFFYRLVFRVDLVNEDSFAIDDDTPDLCLCNPSAAYPIARKKGETDIDIHTRVLSVDISPATFSGLSIDLAGVSSGPLSVIL